jgi:hypothetical protein
MSQRVLGGLPEAVPGETGERNALAGRNPEARLLREHRSELRVRFLM